jgi:hypothetical protein
MMYPILHRWLGVPIPGDEYHRPRPEAELQALTAPLAASRNFKPVVDIALKMGLSRLQAARAERRELPAVARRDQLRAGLRAKLGDIEPNLQRAARVLRTTGYGGFSVEAAVVESDPNIALPLLILNPKPAQTRPAAVLALAQGGKERFLANRAAEIARLLAAGITVCLADVRGTGEIGAGSRAPGGMTLASVELMLGETLLGRQLKDARTLFRYIEGRGFAGRVALWGDSFAGTSPRGLLVDESASLQVGPQVQRQAEPLGSLLALLTALYEDNAAAVAVNGVPGSFLSVLKHRFCYLPLDALAPGLLEVGDIADLASALAPRPLRMQAIVDGRNRRLPADEIHVELGQAAAAYRAYASRLSLHSGGSAPDLAEWLVQQISATRATVEGTR